MKLQLLVPQYKETDDVIINLLNSVAIQQGIDLNEIEVLIMNDGTDVRLSEDFLRQYPFSIKYYLSKHMGVSAVRQALLELATADYVMFCDADDMFSSLLGINLIFTTVYDKDNKPKCDILVPAFYQEILPINTAQISGVKFNYGLKGMQERGGIDGVFVHGKVYRREYLLNNKIKWNSALALNEDSYFNTLALMLTKSVVYCPTPYYIWKHNVNSITRSDPEWNVHNYHTLIESNEALLKEFIARGLTAQAQLYVCQLLYNCYFTTNFDLWLIKKNIQYKNNINNLLRSYLKTYGDYFKQASADLKQKIYANQLAAKGNKKPSITFDAWYKKLI